MINRLICLKQNIDMKTNFIVAFRRKIMLVNYVYRFTAVCTVIETLSNRSLKSGTKKSTVPVNIKQS